MGRRGSERGGVRPGAGGSLFFGLVRSREGGSDQHVAKCAGCLGECLSGLYLPSQRGCFVTSGLGVQVCSCGLVLAADGQWVAPAVRYAGSNSICPRCVESYRVRLRAVAGQLRHITHDLDPAHDGQRLRMCPQCGERETRQARCVVCEFPISSGPALCGAGGGLQSTAQGHPHDPGDSSNISNIQPKGET
jgi:hypothetical protein